MPPISDTVCFKDSFGGHHSPSHNAQRHISKRVYIENIYIIYILLFCHRGHESIHGVPMQFPNPSRDVTDEAYAASARLLLHMLSYHALELPKLGMFIPLCT